MSKTLMLIFALFCSPVMAEYVVWSYKSPNKKCEVKVERTSEAPDFLVTLKQANKILWSFHPDPKDKSVRIFWHPNSSTFLLEHITQYKSYRLYIINIAKNHVRMFPVTVKLNVHLLSIIKGTVVWDQIHNGTKIISLSIQNQKSKKLKMQITCWRLLEIRKD